MLEQVTPTSTETDADRMVILGNAREPPYHRERQDWSSPSSPFLC